MICGKKTGKWNNETVSARGLRVLARVFKKGSWQSLETYATKKIQIFIQKNVSVFANDLRTDFMEQWMWVTQAEI